MTTGQTESTVQTESAYLTDAQLAYPDCDKYSVGPICPAGPAGPAGPVGPFGPIGSVDTSTNSTYTALMALFLISLGHQLSCWETYNLSDATGSPSNSHGSGSAPSLVSDTSGISSREDTNPGDSYDFGSGGGHTYGPDSVPRTVPGVLRGTGGRFEGT